MKISGRIRRQISERVHAKPEPQAFVDLNCDRNHSPASSFRGRGRSPHRKAVSPGSFSRPLIDPNEGFKTFAYRNPVLYRQCEDLFISRGKVCPVALDQNGHACPLEWLFVSSERYESPGRRTDYLAVGEVPPVEIIRLSLIAKPGWQPESIEAGNTLNSIRTH